MGLLTGTCLLPETERAELTADGLQLLEEGLSGSLTLRHFRARAAFSSWRREPTSGAIAISASRLVVCSFFPSSIRPHGNPVFKHIDVPRSGPWRARIAVSADKADRVSFSYELRPESGMSGQVQVRLRTPQAASIVSLLPPA